MQINIEQDADTNLDSSVNLLCSIKDSLHVHMDIDKNCGNESRDLVSKSKLSRVETQECFLCTKLSYLILY